MTLTPLAPMQGPQAQQPGQLPDVPPPMDTAQAPAVQTAQPWHSDVVANFQQAHATLDPMSYGLASGLIGVSPVNPVMPSRGYGSGLLVIPGDGEDTGSGGSNWQPGPNSTPYNQGVDQGPQTQGYAPGVGPGHTDSAGNWIPDTTQVANTGQFMTPDGTGNAQPMSNTPYSVGPNDPSGLQPFTDSGTAPNGQPVAPSNQPFDYSQPGAEVPITDNSVPGGFDIGGGGGED